MVPLSNTSSLSPRHRLSPTTTLSPNTTTHPQLPRLPSDESNPSSTSSNSTSRRQFECGTEIYNTETMQALRDVELAIDDGYADRMSQGVISRRPSTNPRLSILNNPFIELSTRLGSRRVRPIVLELMLALGHYIHVIWSLEYPDAACPWAGMGVGSGVEGEERGGKWNSRVISTIEDGQRKGFVDEVAMRNLGFWKEEVRCGLIDAEGAFGCVKGMGRGFEKAMKAGGYGDVADGNVLGEKGQGGNMARLLNDLEEAVWGEAPPRSTDLAWELPIDFDPYAAPDPSELQHTQSNTHRQSSSAPNPSQPFPPRPLPEREISDPLNPPSHAAVLSKGRRPTVIGHGGGDALDLSAFLGGDEEGGGLSLEEIGKRRHREWVERNKREGMGIMV